MQNLANEPPINIKKVTKLPHGTRMLIKEAKYVFNQHNGMHACKLKSVSTKTQSQRWLIIRKTLITIHELGYKVESINSISQKHIIALAKYWEVDRKYSPGSIQNHLSALRTFFEKWLGKQGLIPEYAMLFSDSAVYRRSIIATCEKTWSAKGVDIEKTLQNLFEYDERIAMQLLVCYAFGLRVREAMCMRPYEADLGNQIQVKRGSKGGRYRIVDIENDAQLAAFELAKTYAFGETKSMIPERYTLLTWQRHFYYAIRVYGGLTQKQLGVTPHGLRHEFANECYERWSGLDAPLRNMIDATLNNKRLDREARLKLAEALGHTRFSITGAYLGLSFGRVK